MGRSCSQPKYIVPFFTFIFINHRCNWQIKTLSCNSLLKTWVTMSSATQTNFTGVVVCSYRNLAQIYWLLKSCNKRDVFKGRYVHVWQSFLTELFLFFFVLKVMSIVLDTTFIYVYVSKTTYKKLKIVNSEKFYFETFQILYLNK